MFCFSKFCLICLSKNNTLVNVDHLASDNVSYLNKLQFVSPTLVEKQCNYMLLWICDRCQAQLNSAYKFLQHCLTTASLLEGYYLQLASTNTEQNVCNNLKEECIENIIKKEECLEDLFEIQDEQYFSESLITVKNELSPVDLKTELKFNDSTFETTENVNEASIYVEEVDFIIIANLETNQVTETNDQNDITSCSDVIQNSNERSVNSSKLLATNRSIQNEKRQNYTNLNRNKSAVNKEKTFECNICKKKFSTSGSLKRHEKNHTGERSYKCNMCPKKFITSSGLKLHERNHTGERSYKCNMCPKKFITSSILKRHQRTHTAERSYKCNTCPKKFITSSDLKRHETTHSEDLSYKCNVCLKKFRQSSSLKIHGRTHNNERPYKCNMCPKKFYRSDQLKIHEMNHTGERPYKCKICPKKYNSSSNLKMHERLHTGELHYTCNMCPKKYHYFNQLKIHKRMHTGERPL